MIFKFFNFKKETNQWMDSKSYYPICIKKNYKPYDIGNDNFQWLYNQLFKHRLVDFDFKHFRVNFGGDSTCLSFRFYYATPFKKIALGKLVQLVKHDSQIEQSIKKHTKSSWLDSITWEPLHSANNANPPRGNYDISNSPFAGSSSIRIMELLNDHQRGRLNNQRHDVVFPEVPIPQEHELPPEPIEVQAEAFPQAHYDELVELQNQY